MSSTPIKDQFPFFTHNPDLTYLDSTATTQKPATVINAMTQFMTHENATVHRGIYGLSQRATERCEAVRESVKTWIHAKSASEIIFTKGTTEGINLIAQGLKSSLTEHSEIILTEMEHHANIVPWQQLGISPEHIKWCRVLDNGELDLDHFQSLLTKKTAIVAMTHVSNVLGTINPIQDCIRLIREKTEAIVIVDGAQALGHMPVDVQALDCDFYCSSAHKHYGPTGIGFLYGKQERLDALPVYQTGGDMIEFVTKEGTTFAKTPSKFEAGTPAIVEIIGLGATIEFITSTGYETLHNIENALQAVAQACLSEVPGLTVIGNAQKKSGIFSFIIDGVHPHDIGTFLDQKNIAIRVGHHCAQPLMKRFNIPATARISLACYNTQDDIETGIQGLKEVSEYFK